MKALITGGTGFLGGRLLRHVDEAVVLTRDPERARTRLGAAVEVHGWAPADGPPPVEAFDGVDVVFNLVGESLLGLWTPRKRSRIRDSRIDATRHLVEGMERARWRSGTLVSASAVGYYGDRGPVPLEESATAGSGFLSDLTVEWEEEADRAAGLGVRVVRARIGIILSASGGALPRMLPLFRLGLGASLGRGTQYWPWIHVDDVVGALMHAAVRSDVAGPVNVVAPAPATNRVFSRVLARAVGRPLWLSVPAPLLRGVLGELSSVLLASQRVMPGALLDSGFRFLYGDLVAALHAELGGRPGDGLGPRDRGARP